VSRAFAGAVSDRVGLLDSKRRSGPPRSRFRTPGEQGVKRIEEPADIPHLGRGMTYKDFYAQAMLSSLSIAYSVEKDLLQGREPTPENVALGASQLAMALTDLLARTIENVADADAQL
jgi:hypothetical protein